ncbi:hypothetical protein Vadar_015017 [Vaccinium darrowii]|uniref:Uncharacterized protein n=1 Tax=Vaccinium darrowii TaxID=229202 RepID=A0ACB7Z4W5_9ERIC|nr:hypothetical protein Vadar_015017 [Vaccinium darrowii]
MKLSLLRSCCEGASVNPAAESAASPPRQQDAPPVKRSGNGQASSRNGGRSMEVKTAKWKPALSVISEDSVVVVSEVGGKQNEGTVRRKKKALDEAELAAAAKSPRRHCDNTGKIHMEIPAIAPTAYLF